MSRRTYKKKDSKIQSSSVIFSLNLLIIQETTKTLKQTLITTISSNIKTSSISQNFENKSNISPGTLADQRISQKTKDYRINFNKKLQISLISPLGDKPQGYVRLPVEVKKQENDILSTQKVNYFIMYCLLMSLKLLIFLYRKLKKLI